MADIKLVCPITGAEVKIVETKHGEFQSPGYFGRVESEFGGYSTGIFPKKEQLQDFFRRRNGVLKGAPLYNPPKIEVREPELVTKDPDQQEKQEARDQDELAKAGAEAVMRRIVRR